MILEEMAAAGPEPAGGWKGNIIICPGGGYQWHSPREAGPVAREFAAAGWKPWVLYYTISEHGEILGRRPLLEAADALRRVREKFPEQPVIVCGFSAGGHVAASLGVHWNDRALFPKEEQSAVRPDGLILCYPVITAGPYAHRESIERLAGDDCFTADYFSLEKHINEQTPPVFLWHTGTDHTVPVENSLLFAASLAENKVPFELHIYPEGEHGLSLATKEVEEPEKARYADAHVAGWFGQCVQWLERFT